MVRAVVVIFMVILASVVSTNVPTSRDKRSFTLEYDDLPGEITSIVLGMKSQLKDLILDIVVQALKFLKDVIFKFKLHFLKKLEKYSLSYVFKIIFDCINSFVVEPSYQVYYEAVKEPVVVKPKLNVHKQLVYDSPYALASLLNAYRK